VRKSARGQRSQGDPLGRRPQEKGRLKKNLKNESSPVTIGVWKGWSVVVQRTMCEDEKVLGEGHAEKKTGRNKGDNRNGSLSDLSERDKLMKLAPPKREQEFGEKIGPD